MSRFFSHKRRIAAFGLSALVLMYMGDGSLRLNAAQAAATPYLYDLFGWELSNFMSKWSHKALDIVPLGSMDDGQKTAQVWEYFRSNDDLNRLRGDLNRAAAEAGTSVTGDGARIQSDLDALIERRKKMTNDVEETIESHISRVVVDEGLSTLGEFIFPPVDVRLSDPPKLLVTSPRDRIERTHDVLLSADVRLADRDAVEQRLLDEDDFSAIVLDIGGIATYPASIPGNQSMRWTLQAASHEWLHHYFFFKPLGRNMFTSGDMFSLNETVANLTGQEIGDRVFEAMGGEIPPEPPPQEAEDEEDSVTVQKLASRLREERFDYNAEMRETRLRVDDLLAEGDIEGAESYMEERRQVFVENGYHIRKLNQAYFAFHGTYADTAASSSPIGDQVRSFRSHYADIGSFLRRVSEFSSYQEFLDALDSLESSAGPDGNG